MATLSYEMNRLLGSAALDPEFSAHILGSRRADAIRSFALSPQEAQAILLSRASTLPELAAELCAELLEPAATVVDRGAGDRAAEPVMGAHAKSTMRGLRSQAFDGALVHQPIAVDHWPVRETIERKAA